MADLKTSQFGTITAAQADSAGTEGYIPYVDPSQVDPDLRNKRMTRTEAKKFFGLDVFTSLSGTSWDGANKTLTLTSNKALTFSSAKRNGILCVKQDGTGGRTLSINGVSVPVASDANTITLVCFFYDDVAGTYVFSYDTNILGNVGGEGGGGGLTQLSTPTLTATVISDTEIDLSWTNVANESSYKLEWSPNGSTGWTQIGGTIAANTTSYNHTGLTASTHYYYRITAVGDGVTYSDSNYGTDDDTTTSGTSTILGSAPWKAYNEADVRITQSGGMVSLIENQVVVAGPDTYDLIQSVGANYPAYVASGLNSLPAITIAPNKSLPQRAALADAARPLVRAALVVFNAMPTGGAYGYIGYFSGGSSRCDFGVDNLGKPFMYSGSLLTGPDALTTGVPYWFWCEYLADGTGNLYINDVLIVNGSTGSHTTYNGGGFGDAADTADANISLMGYIDSLPSGTVRTNVFNAVTAKYGF